MVILQLSYNNKIITLGKLPNGLHHCLDRSQERIDNVHGELQYVLKLQKWYGLSWTNRTGSNTPADTYKA